MLAIVDERFVSDAVMKLAVKNKELLPDKLYIHALVDESVVQYSIAPDMFVILSFFDDVIAIDAVMKLAVKNEA